MRDATGKQDSISKPGLVIFGDGDYIGIYH
jgi:hypothetical protein